MTKSQLLLLMFCLFGYFMCFSQEEHELHSEKKHSIVLILSHTQITEGVDENGKKQWISVPSWGLDYNYELTEHWAIGIHSDIIVEDFVVEHSSEEDVIERSFPIASAMVASYKPGKHFSFMTGLGGEFTKEESFFLIRLGVEYGVHITNNWELIANVINDLKINAYNSFGIGIGIAKKF